MDQYLVPEKAKKYLNHELIRQYTDLPDFPHYRTKLLYSFLSSKTGLKPNYSELYSLVTSLIQIGLDVHDMVDATEPGVSQKQNRPIQLRVLAGDYFSSRFYQLLAQAGQVEWVKLLSAAICEVNRLKMNFYMMVKHLRLSAEEYLRQIVQIRSVLFMSFADVMEGSYRKAWPEVLELFTRCELLSEELERVHHPGRFRQSWGYWYLLQVASQEEQRIVRESNLKAVEPLVSKYRISSHLCGMLDKHLKQLFSLINGFESDKLAEELRSLAEPFARVLGKSAVLEEI